SRCLVSRGGLSGMRSGSDQEAFMFSGDEEESLVPPDRPAYRKSIMLVACGRLRRRKRVCGLEELVVIEVIGCSVQLVGAGLDGQIGRAAVVAPNLSRARCDKGEIINRVDRQQHARQRRNASLIYCRDVPPKIVVVGAFNLPVNRVGPGAVDAGHARAATS